jgi:hypothetical protein
MPWKESSVMDERLLVAHEYRQAGSDSRRTDRGIVGSEEARREALASVRRPNCTCGSPACSFHEDI